ncbi:collagen, type I, alpha 1b-like isoform X1 [Apteryx mantelli]|uniref:Collagen, type I, alpha 1b-like isoform X1 n=1 Tax=Apteryx mantelli TaxID=2696672 RepID=A0ABM4FXI1_9AVES
MVRSVAVLLWAQAFGLTAAQPAQLTLDPPWSPVFVEETVMLTCQGPPAAPRGPIAWYVNGDFWHKTESNQLLVSMEKPRSNSYQCQSPGSELSHPISLAFSNGTGAGGARGRPAAAALPGLGQPRHEPGALLARQSRHHPGAEAGRAAASGRADQRQRPLSLHGHRPPLFTFLEEVRGGVGDCARALLGPSAERGQLRRAPGRKQPHPELCHPPQPPPALHHPPAPLLPRRRHPGRPRGLSQLPGAGSRVGRLRGVLLRGADGNGERTEAQRPDSHRCATSARLRGGPGGAAPRGAAGAGRAPGAELLGGGGHGAHLLLLAPAGPGAGPGEQPPLRDRRGPAQRRRPVPLRGLQRAGRGPQHGGACHRHGAGGRGHHRRAGDRAGGDGRGKPQPELLGAGGDRAGGLRLAAQRAPAGHGLGAAAGPGIRGVGPRRDLPVRGQQPAQPPAGLQGSQPGPGPLGDSPALHRRGRRGERVPPGAARCHRGPGVAPPAPAPCRGRRREGPGKDPCGASRLLGSARPRRRGLGHAGARVQQRVSQGARRGGRALLHRHHQEKGQGRPRATLPGGAGATRHLRGAAWPLPRCCGSGARPTAERQLRERAPAVSCAGPRRPGGEKAGR